MKPRPTVSTLALLYRLRLLWPPLMDPSPSAQLGAPVAEHENCQLDISDVTYISYPLMKEPRLDATFSALADPTRRAILARLAKGEATVMELAGPFEMTQSAISQHLRVLEDAALISQRIDGARRPRRLAKAGIEAMDQWLGMLRKGLEKNYDRLDRVLATLNQKEETL
jgi:DNA-binding transcriptional ArsR family regulator